jgi:hypothetical protein
MKPAIIFEGKGFLCVSKSEDGGLEFFAQDDANGDLLNGALVKLPLKEVRELATYLEEHFQGILPPKKL